MENDLKFAGESPVIINYNGRADELYAPINTSSCDVTIVDENILDDLYTASKDDIVMLVEYGQRDIIRVPVETDPGSVSSVQVSNADSIEIYQRDSFFEDSSHKFFFKGIVKDGNTNHPVVLQYNYNTKKWELNNPYLLNINLNGANEQFFFDRNNSYRIRWDGSSHWISTWSGSDWGSESAYSYYDDNFTRHDCPYGTDQIVKYIDGSIELLFGQDRYTWNTLSKVWYKTNSYSNGTPYTGMYGSWYHRVKNASGMLVDAIIVNGLGNEDWIVELDRWERTFTKLIRLQESQDIDNIFTDDNGGVYCVKSSGKVLYWSWDKGDWFEWITLTGNDFVPDTFALDYVIPAYGTNKKQVVIRYMYNLTTRATRALYLQNFTPPTFRIDEVPGEWWYLNSFVGYMVPNTYSQPVTLNLDNITVSAIDFISIMKNVTIDKLFSKPRIVTYGELFCSAIAYVHPVYDFESGSLVNIEQITVENCVSYGGSYDQTNGLFDLKCQISNFWDESDKPATVYEVIEELLRPFCMRMVYDPSHGFIIYNINNTSTGTRSWIGYTWTLDGKIDERGSREAWNSTLYTKNLNSSEWISNNVSDATIEIDTTYDKVNGIANTSEPSYTKMAIDLIDISQKDKYNYGDLNVNVNKSKGIVKTGENYAPDIDDKWFYLWNGTYANPDYQLVPWDYNPGDIVQWYANCNQAYQYTQYMTTPSSDTGSILDFYGGAMNTDGNGRIPDVEKPVELSKRITAYAADNGVPPEFLDRSDIAWTTNGHYLTKGDQDTNTKFGSGITMGESNRIVYHQEYDNVGLFSNSDPLLNLNISRSFSRTGIDVPIPVMNNNTATNCSYNIWGNLTGADTYYFPEVWNENKIMVNSIYFKRYSTSSSIRVTEVWDRRRIDMYIKLSDDTVLQFNGKDWVADTEVKEENAFYLLKLMNFEQLFHTDHRYNVIETADYDPQHPENGGHYSLSSESFIYYRDNLDHTVYDHDPGTAGEAMEAPAYNGAGQIVSSGEGYLSVKLPSVEDASPVVCVDVYNSSMLGMTGSDTIGSAGPVPFYYPKRNGDGYKEVTEDGGVWVSFLPKNLSHVKAEHIDLKITISVPQSNLGQMFAQSDIEYVIDSKNDYVEEYDGPTFRVNTQNPLVASSYSYILFGNSYADPGEFIIKNMNVRPEAFTVQAYFNWLSTIRKIYTKTIKIYPIGYNTTGCPIFLYSPEIGNNKLMVVSRSLDLKTRRNSITAVECHNLDVDYVNQFLVNELPHKARNERWNYPTATK